MESNPASTTAS
ncbi:hypothetical protein D018_3651, partial [Vibrio parahaemolyticus VP2007-007]